MMKRYLRICSSVIVFSVMAVIIFSELSLAHAQAIVFGFDGKVGSDGIAAPWELKEKSGDANVKVSSDAGEKIVQLKCDDASFSLGREIKVDAKNYPFIIWQWKALKLPPKGDLRKGKTNDQALQLLVAFEGKKVLSYVWDSNAPEGAIGEESVAWPVSLKIKVIAVKSGAADAGKWLTMTRNVYEDYKKFFKEEPPLVKGIRVQSNCQHTESAGAGHFGKIVFSRNPYAVK